MLILLGGCRSSGDRLPEGDALVPLGEPYKIESGAMAPGTVLLFTAGSFRAERPVELESVELLEQDDKVRFHTARITFTASKTRQQSSPAGAFCVPWPVTGYGPSYPAKSLRLEPGEFFAINVFLAGEDVALATARGVRLRYRDGARTVEQTDSTATVVMDITTSQPARCRPSPSEFAVP